MQCLYICSEFTGQRWRVWPDAEIVPPGSVYETGRYLFELSDCDDAVANAADLLIDGVPLEALRTRERGSARWRWTPGFYAGSLQVELTIPGRRAISVEIVTDPDARKLARTEFDVMLREILDDTFALFSLSSFRRSVSRGPGRTPPPIARLEFIRSRVDELEAYIRAIARAPQLTMRSIERSVHYYQASRASGQEILRSFQAGAPRHENGAGARLPPQLRGFLPERIRLRSASHSTDTVEHRQIKACLSAWASWLRSAGAALELVSNSDDANLSCAGRLWAHRCRVLERRLSDLGALALFQDVGESPPVLTLSSTYRNVPAYRGFYRVWRDMNAGLAAIFGSFLSLPLARTYELYELWCFLRLVRAVREEFGSTSATDNLFSAESDGALTLSAGPVRLAIGGGWSICFQRTYREYWKEADGVGSYSRQMIPDVVLAREDGTGGPPTVIVLDAKYRISEGLNEALGSIHMYRDALVHEATTGKIEGVVKAAYLLTPHVAFPHLDYQETPMPARLFHPQYRAGFRFGAATLRPGVSISEIRRTIRRLIADASVAC